MQHLGDLINPNHNDPMSDNKKRIHHDVLFPKDIGDGKTIWKNPGDAWFDKEVEGNIELLGVRYVVKPHKKKSNASDF